MRAATALCRNEARLLRHDPVPTILLVGMPLILMALLEPALEIALQADGFVGASGAAQTVPGMVCVFSYFAVAVVGYALFREHGWHTWPRIRATGVAPSQVIVGKLTLPALMLAAQQVVLFGAGVLFFDLRVSGSWAAVALVSVAFGALVLVGGLAAAAVLDTVQQLNAVTNLGAMIFGGLGGGFVPVENLPGWAQAIAPISPSYWAMQGYNRAILEGGDVGSVLGSVGVLLAFTGALGVVAVLRLRFDRPKRTWG